MATAPSEQRQPEQRCEDDAFALLDEVKRLPNRCTTNQECLAVGLHVAYDFNLHEFIDRALAGAAAGNEPNVPEYKRHTGEPQWSRVGVRLDAAGTLRARLAALNERCPGMYDPSLLSECDSHCFCKAAAKPVTSSKSSVHECRVRLGLMASVTPTIPFDEHYEPTRTDFIVHERSKCDERLLQLAATVADAPEKCAVDADCVLLSFPRRSMIRLGMLREQQVVDEMLEVRGSDVAFAGIDKLTPNLAIPRRWERLPALRRELARYRRECDDSGTLSGELRGVGVRCWPGGKLGECLLKVDGPMGY